LTRAPQLAPTRAFRIAQGVLALLPCAQIGLVLGCALDARRCTACSTWPACCAASPGKPFS